LKIKDLCKHDTVAATVVFRTQKNGVYLEIDGMEDTPVVMAYNFYGRPGKRVVASVQKVDVERNYVRLVVDSIMYADNFAA